MTAVKTPPNCTTGEFCPDFPSPCICPINPAHQHLPVHTSTCGHCREDDVRVGDPRETRETTMTTTEIVLAGGGYCPRCRKTLCPKCEDKDPHLVHRDCVESSLR